MIFPHSYSKDRLGYLAKQLVRTQDKIYESLGVKFPRWQGCSMGLKEVEHALCEYQKYRTIHLILLSGGIVQGQRTRHKP